MDNGGCGAPLYVGCGNNRGAVPTCEDIDECEVEVRVNGSLCIAELTHVSAGGDHTRGLRNDGTHGQVRGANLTRETEYIAGHG